MITIDLDNGNCLTITPENFRHLLLMATLTVKVMNALGPVGDSTMAVQSFIERCQIHRRDLDVGY